MTTAGTVPLLRTPLGRWSEHALPATGAAHLVGICGSGMKALAELLTGLGWQVAGSDTQPTSAMSEVFRRRGLRIHRGHQAGQLQDADLLVYSPAVGPQNPERVEASARGVPQLSYTEMLGWLMRDKTGISVAGTHGKSTTTAMTACVLEVAGLLPSAVFGAELRGTGRSGWAGEGEFFVVESCEYQRSFLQLTPQLAAILSVEPDHFDCFSTFDETIAAFAEFAQRVPADGLLVIGHESAAAHEACRQATAPIETFSLQSEADWWAADLRPMKTGIRFRCFYRGEFYSEIELPVMGQHNALNALAAIALCHAAAASRADVREGLREFSGIRRRFEAVGSWRGVTLIDDFAHHPTAVRATLQTARERFEERRIWCAFQPHQVSRTRALLPEFAVSFAAADEVLVLPVYGAREQFTDELSETSRELVRQMEQDGTAARYSVSLDQTVATLEDELQPGDVLITMGAGNIDQVHYAFTRRLQRHYPAR